jgi:hypothetical protein
MGELTVERDAVRKVVTGVVKLRLNDSRMTSVKVEPDMDSDSI